MQSADEKELNASEQPENEEARKRRRVSGTDSNRNYVCSCGKAYLSYPALYTHIKTKHDGKRQEPEDIESAFTDLLNMITEISKTGSGIRQSGNYTPSELFQNFPNNNQNHPKSSSASAPNPPSFQPILQAVEEYLQNKKPEFKSNSEGAYDVPIDKVFGYFIYKMMNKVDKEILREILIFLMIWRDSYNANYVLYVPDVKVLGLYSQEGTAMRILEIVNDLIVLYFPEQYREYRNLVERPRFLAENKKQFHLCKFVYYMAMWMYAEKFTNSKVHFNGKCYLNGEGK